MNQIILKPLVEEKPLTPTQVKAEAYKALADLNHYHIGNTAKVRAYVAMIEPGYNAHEVMKNGPPQYVGPKADADGVLRLTAKEPKTPSIMDSDFGKEDELEQFKAGLHRAEDGVTFEVQKGAFELPEPDWKKAAELNQKREEVGVEPKRRGRPPKAKVEGK